MLTTYDYKIILFCFKTNNDKRPESKQKYLKNRLNIKNILYIIIIISAILLGRIGNSNHLAIHKFYF